MYSQSPLLVDIKEREERSPGGVGATLAERPEYPPANSERAGTIDRSGRPSPVVLRAASEGACSMHEIPLGPTTMARTAQERCRIDMPQWPRLPRRPPNEALGDNARYVMLKGVARRVHEGLVRRKGQCRKFEFSFSELLDSSWRGIWPRLSKWNVYVRINTPVININSTRSMNDYVAHRHGRREPSYSSYVTWFLWFCGMSAHWGFPRPPSALTFFQLSMGGLCTTLLVEEAYCFFFVTAAPAASSDHPYSKYEKNVDAGYTLRVTTTLHPMTPDELCTALPRRRSQIGEMPLRVCPLPSLRPYLPPLMGCLALKITPRLGGSSLSWVKQGSSPLELSVCPLAPAGFTDNHFLSKKHTWC